MGTLVDAAGPSRVWPDEWARHHGDLVRYVGHLLSGDLHAAEDVAQETAIRLWQHPEVLATDQPVTSWLRTVAHNIVVDRTRRRRVRPAEVTLTPGTDHPGPDAFEDVHAAEAASSILAGLSSRHREVVVQVYLRDRPLADVATELGLPVGTVKSRCHHALRQLRASFSVRPGC